MQLSIVLFARGLKSLSKKAGGLHVVSSELPVLAKPERKRNRYVAFIVRLSVDDYTPRWVSVYYQYTQRKYQRAVDQVHN